MSFFQCLSLDRVEFGIWFGAWPDDAFPVPVDEPEWLLIDEKIERRFSLLRRADFSYP